MEQLEVDDLKQRGDQAYKASCFTQAISHYTAAINLGRKCQSIYANRSASKFESGDYAGSLEDATAAFELDASSDLAQKVALRACRACYWSSDITSACAWLEEAHFGSSRDTIAVLRSHLKSFNELRSAESANALPQLLMHRTSTHSEGCWRMSCSDSAPRSLLGGVYSPCSLRCSSKACHMTLHDTISYYNRVKFEVMDV